MTKYALIASEMAGISKSLSRYSSYSLFMLQIISFCAKKTPQTSKEWQLNRVESKASFAPVVAIGQLCAVC